MDSFEQLLEFLQGRVKKRMHPDAKKWWQSEKFSTDLRKWRQEANNLSSLEQHGFKLINGPADMKNDFNGLNGLSEDGSLKQFVYFSNKTCEHRESGTLTMVFFVPLPGSVPLTNVLFGRHEDKGGCRITYSRPYMINSVLKCVAIKLELGKLAVDASHGAGHTKNDCEHGSEASFHQKRARPEYQSGHSKQVKLSTFGNFNRSADSSYYHQMEDENTSLEDLTLPESALDDTNLEGRTPLDSPLDDTTLSTDGWPGISEAAHLTDIDFGNFPWNNSMCMK